MPKRPASQHKPRHPKSEAQKLYGHAWRQARERYLHEHPCCVRCHPRVTEATIVDHKTPHRGDLGLFWDQKNWQSLCKPCHDAKTGNEDSPGFASVRKRGAR